MARRRTSSDFAGSVLSGPIASIAHSCCTRSGAAAGMYAFGVAGKSYQRVLAQDDVRSQIIKIPGAGAQPTDADMEKVGELVLKTQNKDKFKGQTSLAIYEVDGDTFKWCAAEPGKDERPKEFTAKAGEARYMYVVFKRAAKKE